MLTTILTCCNPEKLKVLYKRRLTENAQRKLQGLYQCLWKKKKNDILTTILTCCNSETLKVLYKCKLTDNGQRTSRGFYQCLWKKKKTNFRQVKIFKNPEKKIQNSVKSGRSANLYQAVRR